jgi:hypothetical protein
MSIRRTVLSLALLGLGLAPLGFAQIASPARQSSQRVLGYLDPATGVFQAVHPAVEIDPATASTETGELIVKYTITVKSTIPKNGVIGCGANATTGDVAGEYEERATGVATGSGASYTCSAIIHYSWLLNNPTTDPVNLSGGVSIEYGYQGTASNGSAVAVQLLESRGSSPYIPPLKSVPANGLTTTINVSVTL